MGSNPAVARSAKKWGVLLAAAVLLASTWPRTGQARQWSIDPGDRSGLTKALAEAEPGDLIGLAPGVHFPPDRMSPARSGRPGKPITIAGAGAEKTILAAGGNKYGFLLEKKSYIVIRDLALEGFTGCGIKLIDSRRIRLSRLKVSGSTSHNISLVGAEDSLIENCWSFDSKSSGFFIGPNKRGLGGRRNVVRNSFSFRNLSQGILIHGSENTIVGNAFVANGRRTPYDHGIYLIGRNNRVIRNLCRDNAFGSGVRVGYSDHLIQDNVLIANGRSGVVVAGTNPTERIAILDNLIAANNLAGVEINASKFKPDRIHLQGNLIRENRGNLWLKAGVKRVTVVGNVLSAPSAVQVRIDGPAGRVRFSGNRFFGPKCAFQVNGRPVTAPAFFKELQPETVCYKEAYTPETKASRPEAGPGAGSRPPWPGPRPAD